MTYQQIGDTLNLIRRFHQQFRDALEAIEGQTDHSSTDWIAEGLRQHEQHWQMALAEYGDEDEDAVLNTWIRFIPDQPIRDELDAIVVTRDLSAEEVSQLAIRFHSALMELYETLAKNSSTPRVQEVFSRLMELEQSVAARQAWSVRSPQL